MSKGFHSGDISGWVLQGIKSAFNEWLEMSGEWLQTAPEYLLTVHVAQKLKKSIPENCRTLLMESHVASTIADAGGVQRGPKAMRMRAGGRYDIVLGHGNGLPRFVIELKNPLWTPMGKGTLNDLHRICSSLLHGKANTQLYSGLFAFYTSSAPPVRKDKSAADRLQRRWLDDWEPALKSWDWAGPNKAKYSKHLRIAVEVKIHELTVGTSRHAWAAGCVQITRKPRPRTIAGYS